MIKNRLDIFCRIVDNFGDIGIVWRLSKQLCHEYQFTVRIWVDDLIVAARIINKLNPTLADQIIEKIEIRQWSNTVNFANIEVADIVIEGFACELPEPYISKMALSPPLWLNLEYLSAESWVNDFHKQVSIHPIHGLKKVFFFPGFNENTGGLIREQDLSARRDSFKKMTRYKRTFGENLT